MKFRLPGGVRGAHHGARLTPALPGVWVHLRTPMDPERVRRLHGRTSVTQVRPEGRSRDSGSRYAGSAAFRKD